MSTYQALMSVFSSLQALASVNPFISDLQSDNLEGIPSKIISENLDQIAQEQNFWIAQEAETSPQVWV